MTTAAGGGLGGTVALRVKGDKAVLVAMATVLKINPRRWRSMRLLRRARIQSEGHF
jgi:hypothetical protein